MDGSRDELEGQLQVRPRHPWMVAMEVEGGAQQRYFEGQLIGLASGLDVVHEGRVRPSTPPPVRRGLNFAFREMEKAVGDAVQWNWQVESENWKLGDLLGHFKLEVPVPQASGDVKQGTGYNPLAFGAGLNLGVVSVYMVLRVKRRSSSREWEDKCKNRSLGLSDVRTLETEGGTSKED